MTQARNSCGEAAISLNDALWQQTPWDANNTDDGSYFNTRLSLLFPMDDSRSALTVSGSEHHSGLWPLHHSYFLPESHYLTGCYTQDRPVSVHWSYFNTRLSLLFPMDDSRSALTVSGSDWEGVVSASGEIKVMANWVGVTK